MKKLNFTNLTFNLVVTFILGALLSVPVAVSACVAVGAGTAISFLPSGGILFSGLQKEIWTDILLENFYPDSSFLSSARDMSSLVEFNKINLAEAGANPEVLIDNTSYPISVSSRTDIPHEVVLKTLDTTSTVVRNLEAMELSYDKMASAVYGHKQELLRTACKLGAWNFAPASDGTYTPVLTASGDLVNGKRKLKISDVLRLFTAFNDMDIPDDGRILVLNPQHEADLIAEDLALYKAAIVSGTLFSFKLFRTSATPKYNVETGAKCAYGAVAADTDGISSFAFFRDEVMKAQGTMEMFSTLKDPANKGDIFNFQMRFVALPLRAKYFAAIYSQKS